MTTFISHSIYLLIFIGLIYICATSALIGSQCKLPLYKSCLTPKIQMINNEKLPYKKRQNIASIENHKKFNDLNETEDDNSDLDFIDMKDEERLQKVIARAGIASRREAEKMILDGRVTVNGKIISELGSKVKARKDIILVDGKKINLPSSKDIFWVAVNKPKSVLSTIGDYKERDTIGDIVPKAKELRLVTIGGLDRDSTGLLLLTNDVGWIHPLTHPSFKHQTRYDVVIQGIPTEEELDKLRNGIQLVDSTRKLASCSIKVAAEDKPNNLTLVDITLQEVMSNQLEKMFEAIKYPVISMKRTEYATIKLKGLKKGQWKELSTADVENLKKSCEKVKSN